jgi:hypothetical protein
MRGSAQLRMLVRANTGAGVLAGFIVSGIDDPATAGVASDVTVTAIDGQGNVLTTYLGEITFDPITGATLPVPYTFTPADAGVHTFTNGVTFTVAGAAVTVSVYATASPGKTGSQTVEVLPNVPASLVVTLPIGVIGAGTDSSVTVTAYDAYGNVATGSSATVTLTSSDGAAVLAAPHALAAGTYTFPTGVNFHTSGNQTVTGTIPGPIADTSGTILVLPAALDHFTVTGIADPVVAGVLSSPVVTAKDVYNNTVTSSTVTVTLTSSDGAAVLPAPAALVAGVKTFTNGVQLKTAGEQSVTATSGAITGSQSNITVTPAAAATFTVVTADPAVAGTGENVLVTALDAYGNTDTNFVGVITLTCTDGSATLAAPAAAVAGVKNFTPGVTYGAAGTFDVDADSGGVHGEQNGIVVTLPSPFADANFLTGFYDPNTHSDAALIGDPISNWAAANGLAALVQADAGKRPLLAANNRVTFDGVDNFLALDAAGIALIAGKNDITIMYGIRFDTVGIVQYLYRGDGPGGSDFLGFRQIADNTVVQDDWRGAGATDPFLAGATNTTDLDLFMSKFRRNAAGQYSFNNAAFSTGASAAANAVIPSFTTFNMGSGNGAFEVAGNVAFMLIFNTAISSAQLALYAEFLNNDSTYGTNGGDSGW